MNAHPRLSLNQATIKYANLTEAIAATVDAGYASIGLWREPVQEAGLGRSIREIDDSGLRVSSLCRGGFFTMEEGAERRASIDDNRRAIAEASALGAPALRSCSWPADCPPGPKTSSAPGSGCATRSANSRMMRPPPRSR
jgi:sugar phosphate isomerase/epimerase